MNEIEINQTQELIEIFKKQFNVDIAYYDIAFLYRTLTNRLDANKLNNTEKYLKFISSDSNESKRFLESLKITYSEFFRHGLTFEVLSKVIFPQIIQRNSSKNALEIRIWSMACASGQEPYSLAILLKELLNNYVEQINFRIFATDINKFQLEKANKGVFSALELKNVSLNRLKKWFVEKDNNFTISSEIKKHIEFSEFDLNNEYCTCPPNSIFGGFDLTICANILFYLNHESQTSVLNKIKHCSNSNGYVATGDCERDIFINNHFQEIYPPSGIFKI